MRTILLILALLLPSLAWANKVALVIGNGTYHYTNPLPNAPNDAADMAAALSDLGFTVFGGIDLTQAETLAAVDDFSAALTPTTLALFFYAGHGAQIGAENVVIPVDAQGGTSRDLMASSVRLATILRTMELRADRRVVILDACRNNPFLEEEVARGGTPAPGLARVEAGVGSYIAFSTQPGNVALDGSGRNSPFTASLLAHMGAPGMDIHAMMRRVRSDVVAATGQTQVPWENSSLVEELYLVSAPGTDNGQVAGADVGSASQPLAFAPAAIPQPAAPQPFAAAPAPAPAPGGSNPFAPSAAAPPLAAPGSAPSNPFAGIDLGPEEDDGPAVGPKVATSGNPFAPAAAQPQVSYYVVSGLADAGYGFLTLREAPDSGAMPLGSLTDGTPVEILEAQGEWVYLRDLGGQEGWAAAQWVTCCAQ